MCVLDFVFVSLDLTFWSIIISSSIILEVFWLSSYVLQNRVPDKKPD